MNYIIEIYLDDVSSTTADYIYNRIEKLLDTLGDMGTLSMRLEESDEKNKLCEDQ